MMAKPRRHDAHRLLGTGREADQTHETATDVQELAEDEVFWWAATYDGEGSSGCSRHDPHRTGESVLSLSLEDGSSHRRASAAATSLPKEVPVWPSFLRDESASPVGFFGKREEEEEEEEDGGWVAPHEYLARERERERERERGAAKSVLEGVGRTLKGRDISRIQDAVWSRTGFSG